MEVVEKTLDVEDSDATWLPASSASIATSAVVEAMALESLERVAAAAAAVAKVLAAAPVILVAAEKIYAARRSPVSDDFARPSADLVDGSRTLVAAFAVAFAAAAVARAFAAAVAEVSAADESS